MLLSDWPALVAVLTAKSESVLDDSERASLLRRVGEAKRDMLDDRAGAIAAYERAFELDPESAFTIDCLIELYEAAGNATRLVELYQRRVELTSDDDADQKFDLLVAAAKTYEEKLDDRTGAIDAYARALAVKPRDKAGARGAEPALPRRKPVDRAARQSRRRRSTSTTDAAERAALHKEIGRGRERKAVELRGRARGVPARRSQTRRTTRESVDAVRTIGKEHDTLRRTVAEILVPVLEQTERWEALADLLELRLTVESEAARTHADALGDGRDLRESSRASRPTPRPRCFAPSAKRPTPRICTPKLRGSPRCPAAGPATPRRLSERAGSTFDADVARDLYVRLGKVAEERLQRRPSERSRRTSGRSSRPATCRSCSPRSIGSTRASNESRQGRRRARASRGARLRRREQAELYHRLADIQVRALRGSGARARFAAVGSRARTRARSVGRRRSKSSRRSATSSRRRPSSSRASTGRRATRPDSAGCTRSACRSPRVPRRAPPCGCVSRACSSRTRAMRASGQAVLEQGLAEAPGDAGLLDEIERLAATTGALDERRRSAARRARSPQGRHLARHRLRA